MKSKIDPTIGITPAALRSKIRSALRKVWRETTRRQFMIGARVPHEGPGRGKYDVICELCGKRMGFSEKAIMTNKDGTKRKSPSLVYNVDHIDGNARFLDIDTDLGAYVTSLIYGKLRILCVPCHSEHTKNQRKK